MTMKKKSTKKPARLQAVKQPPNPLQELREQSQSLGDLRIQEGTIQDVLEEIMKALAPLRYLKNASIDFSEELNEFVVSGYLQLFLRHMDALLARGETILMYSTPHDHAA